ncbi:MAG: hypothetical protein ABI411_17115, partial [Tahibacter sp.]
EHYLDMVGVTGSIPVAPTSFKRTTARVLRPCAVFRLGMSFSPKCSRDSAGFTVRLTLQANCGLPSALRPQLFDGA